MIAKADANGYLGTNMLTKNDDDFLKETACSCSSKDSVDQMSVVEIDQSRHCWEGGFEIDDGPHVFDVLEVI